MPPNMVIEEPPEEISEELPVPPCIETLAPLIDVMDDSNVSLPVPPCMVIEEPPEDGHRVAAGAAEHGDRGATRRQHGGVAAAAGHGDVVAADGRQGVVAGAAVHGDGGGARGA